MKNADPEKHEKNEEYFGKCCEIACLLLNREDKQHSAIKCILRHVIRQATNFSSVLPGYDNKMGASKISVSALDSIKSGNTSELIGEHVVPISVIDNELRALKDPTKDEIANIIRRLHLRAVITKKEDEYLKEIKLSKAMPADWDGNNLMYRYVKANIVVEDINVDARKKIRPKK
jgi:hypothetical protein